MPEKQRISARPFISWALALLVLLFLFFTLARFDARNLLHSIRQISLLPLAALLLAQIATQLLVNLQWHITAKSAGAPVSFWEMFRINCSGALMDSITPGVKIGGEITRAVLIGRATACSGEQAAAIVALQKVFSLGAFFLINLFAAAYVIQAASFFQTPAARLSVYGILLLFLIFFACLLIIPARLKALVQAREKARFAWMARVRNFFLGFLDSIISIRGNAKICAALFLLSLFIWLLYPAKMYLLAVLFSPSVDILFLAAVTFVSYLAAMVPIFPGGLGAFEGTMSALLLTMGFEHSDALVITVIFRFATFWFVMLGSLCFIGVYKATRR